MNKKTTTLVSAQLGCQSKHDIHGNAVICPLHEILRKCDLPVLATENML